MPRRQLARLAAGRGRPAAGVPACSRGGPIRCACGRTAGRSSASAPAAAVAALEEVYASTDPESLPTVRALRKQEAADQRRITIRQLNLFHRSLLDAVCEPYPRAATRRSQPGARRDEGGIPRLSVSGPPRQPAHRGWMMSATPSSGTLSATTGMCSSRSL